ncbi:hypothetical protein [Streptomyces sp. SID3212]|uniref:hypothetical protein n=1 Tax=Streptomyces sp. SID3212 TaxID=2690259 RepID=UPI00136D8E01|nr:hypothetical protein [Streptomyces sp. SID3212]MYV56482.1 hypothetical protein [Streptomyces sp. SID3212]
MSDNLTAALVGLESWAFRAGQVGRRLVQEHPELASADVASMAFWNSANLTLTDVSLGSGEIERWAALLGIELTHEVTQSRNPTPSHAAFDCLKGEMEFDGVRVELRGIRGLTQEQWDAAQAQPEGGVAA